MRIGVIVLPILPWREARPLYARLDRLGIDTIWSYDHLVWRDFADRPWQATVPLLTAIAGATHHTRLGTLVATPNFRHPVTFAKELMTVDDVSGGRITLGLGAGGAGGWDATALGQEPWSRGERTARFEEFTEHLDLLLREPRVERLDGRFYAAREARCLPGCTQRPRIPFWLAATGPRGLRLVARQGQGWIGYGPPVWPDDLDQVERDRILRTHLDGLARACDEEGRDPASLERLFMSVPTREHWWASADAFRELTARYAGLGFTEVALHYPHPHPPFDIGPPERFEAVLAEVLADRAAAPSGDRSEAGDDPA